jgi:hypothetical protein
MTKAERRAECGRRNGPTKAAPSSRPPRRMYVRGYIRQCFAGFTALRRFLTPERQQLARPSDVGAGGLGTRPAFASPRHD